MALVGTGSKNITIRKFNNSTLDWPETPDADPINVFAGQGYLKPENEDWINKPTLNNLLEGAVMGFPRSAEEAVVPPPDPDDPQANTGNRGWKLKEC